MVDAPKGPLQTVDRAMDVLLSFSETRAEWGVYELAEHFGWTKSTAQRVLAALAARGFLWADPYSRRYSLGPAVWRMSALWERTGGLERVANDPLRRLAEETGFNAVLAVPDGAFMRSVAAAIGRDGPMRSRPMLGEQYPAHAGATARAYFAFAEEQEQRLALYDVPLGRYTDATEVDVERVKELFRQAAADGYALTVGEWDANTWAVAAPVWVGSRVVASLSLGGTWAADATREDLLRFVAPTLRTAGELGDLLASRVSAPRRDWRLGQRRAHDAARSSSGRNVP